MLLRKKKLINIKFKHTPESKRFQDQQYSIQDNENFKITVKNSTYHFLKSKFDNTYQLTQDENVNPENVFFDKALKVKHKDGTDVYFSLHEDFLYSIEYDFLTYILIAILVNVIIFGSVQLLVPLLTSDEEISLKSSKDEIDTRVVNFLQKLGLKRRLEASYQETANFKQDNTRSIASNEVNKNLSNGNESGNLFLLKYKVRLSKCFENNFFKNHRPISLKLEWKLSPAGRSSNFKVQNSTANDHLFYSCVSSAISSIHFPNPGIRTKKIIAEFIYTSTRNLIIIEK